MPWKWLNKDSKSDAGQVPNETKESNDEMLLKELINRSNNNSKKNNLTSSSIAEDNTKQKVEPVLTPAAAAAKPTSSSDDSPLAVFKSLSCDHYEFEYKECQSFRTKLYNYMRGESALFDCAYLQHMFIDCLKYEREPTSNLEAFNRLRSYEASLMQRRDEARLRNDVWEARREPPADWNAPLPDWLRERLQETSWYKSAAEATTTATSDSSRPTSYEKSSETEYHSTPASRSKQQ